MNLSFGAVMVVKMWKMLHRFRGEALPAGGGAAVDHREIQPSLRRY